MVLFQTLYNNLLSVPFSSRKTENYDGKETFPKQFGILLYAANTRQHFYYEVVTEKWEKWEKWETSSICQDEYKLFRRVGSFT